MIKARPVAGDLELGQALLEELRPFVWRKHLDFYAIQDIHSIKRQIHSHKGGERIAVAGHNVKLGRGGIREIEFFVQTQQLIWGGRNPYLRCARTLDGLQALVDAGHLAADTAKELAEAYRFLRRVENRLQMQDDRQVHALATKPEELELFAAFLGYQGAQPFAEELVRLESHHGQMLELIENSSAAVGKRIDFLLQEMAREANTIGSKVQDGTMTPHVIALKACIEQMREQAQNVL